MGQRVSPKIDLDNVAKLSNFEETTVVDSIPALAQAIRGLGA